MPNGDRRQYHCYACYKSWVVLQTPEPSTSTDSRGYRLQQQRSAQQMHKNEQICVQQFKVDATYSVLLKGRSALNKRHRKTKSTFECGSESQLRKHLTQLIREDRPSLNYNLSIDICKQTRNVLRNEA